MKTQDTRNIRLKKSYRAMIVIIAIGVFLLAPPFQRSSLSIGKERAGFAIARADGYGRAPTGADALHSSPARPTERLRSLAVRPFGRGELRPAAHDEKETPRSPHEVRDSIIASLSPATIGEISRAGGQLEQIAEELAQTNTEYGKMYAFSPGYPNIGVQRRLIISDLGAYILSKMIQGDRTFIVCGIGLGNYPMELAEFLNIFYRELEHLCGATGDDPKRWNVHVYGVDATDAHLDTARSSVMPAGTRSAKLHWIKLNILDAQGLETALLQKRLVKADYILFRHVYNLSGLIGGQGNERTGILLRRWGLRDWWSGRTWFGDVDFLRVALRTYIACRNIYSLAKPNSRLIIEPSKDVSIESSAPVFLPPGCSFEKGFRGAGILTIDDPGAIPPSLKRFVQHLRRHAYDRMGEMYEMRDDMSREWGREVQTGI